MTNQNNLKTIIIIAMISLAIPFTVHLYYKNENNSKITYKYEDPGYGFELQLRQQLDQILLRLQDQQNVNVSSQAQINTNNVKWMNSPVTQEWVYDSNDDLWKTEKSYDRSLRSLPTIRLGLRDDGVVIWEKVNVR